MGATATSEWRSGVDTRVRDNPDEQRFEIRADGELAGFAQYRPFKGGLAFMHTQIDQQFEGKGLASVLVREALDDVRTRGVEVLPFCPFVRGYIEKHPEYVDLVPERDRDRFDL
jgi:predicted GNAT family acetyltransferase